MHGLTGVHLGLYVLTDWLSLIPAGIAAGFALVVMYDAFNVRRAAGEHAKHINQMWIEMREELQSVPAMDILKESLGHTPLQVVVGALLGSGVGALAVFFK